MDAVVRGMRANPLTNFCPVRDLAAKSNWVVLIGVDGGLISSISGRRIDDVFPSGVGTDWAGLGDGLTAATELSSGWLLLFEDEQLMMLLRLDSKRDSEAVSGRMARMRVTGRVERTLRKRACFSGDT